MILLLLTACIELDFFAFEADPALSIDQDYHGLPLFQGEGAPAWIDEDSVEREIWIGDVHAAFLPAPVDCPVEECPLVDSGVTFIYQHGNSGDLFRYWYRAVALNSLGASVLVYTYRGYGLSPGEPSRASILEDTSAATEYLLSRDDVDPERIVAYGYSMGAIPTAYMVGEGPWRSAWAGVVLESGLDSIEGILATSTGADIPGSFFFDETLFDGPTFIQGADLPILHIHGDQDTRVLPWQAQAWHEVLADRPEYTAWLGTTEEGPDAWLSQAAHRNVPLHTFKAEHHIADYWDDPTNPSHCCVHPGELVSPEAQGFLEAIGLTDGDEALAASEAYRALVAAWVLEWVVDGS